MSFSDNKFNIHEMNRPKNNLSEEDEEILEALNLSSNIDKNNANNKLLSKENNNEIRDTQFEIGKREFESDFLGKKNKYIKKYKSDDSRLYGITFQSSAQSDLINVAVSSLNMNTNNNINNLICNKNCTKLLKGKILYKNNIIINIFIIIFYLSKNN